MTASPWNSTVALAVALGCATHGDQQEPHPWAVDPTPAPSIGVETGAPEYELDQAYSARLLPAGGIAVANTGTHQVRFYDHAGTFVRSVGREGKGPGEFAGIIRLLPGPGDSLTVADMGTDRLTILGSDGGVGRSVAIDLDPLGDRPATAWVYRATLLLDGGHRAEVRNVIDRTPEPAAAMLGRIDQTGALWLHHLDRPGNVWEVYRLDGSSLATVSLPESFELFQADSASVLGRERDSLAVERIVRYRVHREDAMASALPPGHGSAGLSADGAEALRQDVRHLIGIQEAYYMGHAAYAPTVDSLAWSGVGTPTILIGDERGWLAIVVGEGGSCAAGVGYPTPLFWNQGTPVCSR